MKKAKRRSHRKKSPKPKVKPPHGYAYIVEDFATSISAQDLEAKLNQLGEENWYLSGIAIWALDKVRFCFVRDGAYKPKE